MSHEAPSADDWSNYIECHTPQAGDFRQSTFFPRLLGMYEPGQQWPAIPTENPTYYCNPADNWMFWAGVSIAKNERRVNEMLDAARELADAEMQTDVLICIIKEEQRPDLLDEASAKWEEHVFKARQDVISDQDLNPTYEDLCVLAARYKRPDIFEANLSRLPFNLQASVLADAAMEHGDLELLERAVRRLESLEEESAYQDPEYVARRAAELGNYDASIRALITHEDDLEYEGEGTVSEIIRRAIDNNMLNDLRRAVRRYAPGSSLYYLSVEMTKAGDAESAAMAVQSLHVLPLDKYLLYGNACKVFNAIKGINDTEVRAAALGDIRKFIKDTFYDAYAAGNTELSFNAALAFLKNDHSLELMRILLFDKKGAAESISEELVEEGEWGAWGPTGLMICLLEEGEQRLAQYYLGKGQEPFEAKYLNEEADEMLTDGMITQDQYQTLMTFLGKAAA
ncbi:MAG: hypothetical protein JWL89_159 [Candidatus Saccharibacteria bacterium]|nr:hypothetical protein [Candidatus Saccharibacteria bacterium]